MFLYLKGYFVWVTGSENKIHSNNTLTISPLISVSLAMQFRLLLTILGSHVASNSWSSCLSFLRAGLKNMLLWPALSVSSELVTLRKSGYAKETWVDIHNYNLSTQDSEVGRSLLRPAWATQWEQVSIKQKIYQVRRWLRVYKVLAMCSHENLSSISKNKNRTLVWWHVLVKSVLGRQKDRSLGLHGQPA